MVQGLSTKPPTIKFLTCRVTARINSGCLLHRAPTGTAPALQAVRAVREGEETPKEKR